MRGTGRPRQPLVAPRAPLPASRQAPIAQPIDATPAPAAEASAASEPLRLDLSHGQLRALEAEAAGRLAARAPHTTARSPYDALAPEADGLTTIELPHGVTEVHSHGGCFRLSPTPRAQSDPFNHGGERLTGPCLPSF